MSNSVLYPPCCRLRPTSCCPSASGATMGVASERILSSSSTALAACCELVVGLGHREMMAKKQAGGPRQGTGARDRMPCFVSYGGHSYCWYDGSMARRNKVRCEATGEGSNAEASSNEPFPGPAAKGRRGGKRRKAAAGHGFKEAPPEASKTLSARATEAAQTLSASESKAVQASSADAESEESDAIWQDKFPAYMQSRGDGGSIFAANGTPAGRESGSGNGSLRGPGGGSGGGVEGGERLGREEYGSRQNLTAGRRWHMAVDRRGAVEGDVIWDTMRAEAQREADEEPLLSSFLYASILAHSCFERSLAFVLANRLKNVTLLATQLTDVFDDVLMHAEIREAIRADVQAVRERDPACRSYSCALLYYKGYHALQAHRIAHALWCRGQQVLALALQSRISEVFAVDIHPAARIGQGILLDHGTGVVIGETAVVGNRVSIMQCVTLGGTGKETGDRHPKIGEGVLIGAGATILGNIKIGEGCMIAAGSLVLKDVPPHSMVAGSPAKIVGTLKEDDPALTMKHDVARTFCEELEQRERELSEAEVFWNIGSGI